MALTQITTGGLANGAVTSSKISNTVQLGGPTISQIQITDSSYNVLDDTAVSTSGGYIKITGTGFAAGAIVVIGSVNATSTGFVSSTVLNVQVPALTAGTYTVYVVNTNGGTAIGVNGLTYSGSPTWVTASTLPNGVSSTPISIQLSATGDTPMTYALAAGNTLPSGLTLTSGGLLSGTVTVGIETVYAFTVVATDVQLQDSPRAFTITISVGDPYFYLTTLLLPGNGTNNGTNNTFLDSSTNNFTVTRNGNTTQGTFTPFSLTGWSNYFDGTGDYLNLAYNNAFNLGTGSFTWEAWIYPTSISGIDGIYATTGGTGSVPKFVVHLNAGTPNIHFNGLTGGADIYTPATSAVAVNTWTHLAFVRNSSTWTWYINGVASGTGSNSTDITFTSQPTYIGYGGESYFTEFNGYISNMRLVKGTAVYTSNFTPSISPLTAIANTSLLTCQNNRFIDNSTNNFTITRNGDTSVQSFSPFAPISSYSAGTVGGSAYFDGTSDTLVIPYSATLAAGTGPYCFEAWVYFTTSGGTQGIIGTSSDGFAGFERNTGSWGYYVGGSGINTGVTAVGGQWNHVVVCRDNSSNFGFFVNGTRLANGTDSQNKQNFGNPTVGYNGIGTHFTGYISDYRYVKGATPYNPLSSTITVPTAPLTAISGTTILLSATNGQIIDATSKNLLETLGDAKISTAQSKWGGSSIYFDGTGDYLVTPSTAVNTLAGDFTVEMWVYRSAGNNFFFTLGDSFGSTGFDLYIGNTGANLRLYSGNSVVIDSAISSINFPTSTWTHLALVRSSGSVRLYVAGVQAGSAWASSAVFSGRVYVGAEFYNGGITGTCNGYMNDVRVTNGIARYTTNFTPPTSAFPTL